MAKLLNVKDAFANKLHAFHAFSDKNLGGSSSGCPPFIPLKNIFHSLGYM